MERKKPGPAPRGDRRMANFRLPVHLLDALREHAAAQGMTATDFVGQLIADEVGVPYLAQEGLPLTKAS